MCSEPLRFLLVTSLLSGRNTETLMVHAQKFQIEKSIKHKEETRAVLQIRACFRSSLFMHTEASVRGDGPRELAELLRQGGILPALLILLALYFNSFLI